MVIDHRNSLIPDQPKQKETSTNLDTKNLFSSENKDITMITTQKIKYLEYENLADDNLKFYYYIREKEAGLAISLFEKKRKKINLNYKDSNGNTYLINAIKTGFDDIIEFLLKNGEDPNVSNVSFFIFILFILFIFLYNILLILEI